jgi:hypothetical protein
LTTRGLASCRARPTLDAAPRRPTPVPRVVSCRAAVDVCFIINTTETVVNVCVLIITTETVTRDAQRQTYYAERKRQAMEDMEPDPDLPRGLVGLTLRCAVPPPPPPG